MTTNHNQPKISKFRLISGGIILIAGFFSPALIPLVTNSNLSVAWKTGISSVLAFGVPELAMVIAVAILGKPGYAFLKNKLISFLTPLAPPSIVSKRRYRIGIILFCLPIILGWLHPYLSSHISIIDNLSIWYHVFSDGVFLISFFILGGEFWDKFRSLFVYSSKVEFTDQIKPK